MSFQRNTLMTTNTLLFRGERNVVKMVPKASLRARNGGCLKCNTKYETNTVHLKDALNRNDCIRLPSFHLPSASWRL